MESSEDGLPSHIEAVLLSLEALSAQIADIEHEMATVLDREPTAKLLMSMPGVGPITALRFMAAVDDVTRFGSAQALTSYLGLHAGERSSGQTRRRTGIIKAGPSAVRHALGQAAWSLWRNRPEDPMVLWAGASPSDATDKSPSPRSRARWPASCTRCGATVDRISLSRPRSRRPSAARLDPSFVPHVPCQTVQRQ